MKTLAASKPVTTLVDLEDTLRTSIRTSEASLRTISIATGISKTHLANFKNAERNLSFQNLDTLAQYFKVRYVLRNF